MNLCFMAMAMSPSSRFTLTPVVERRGNLLVLFNLQLPTHVVPWSDTM